jgi:hypothetical protein
VLVVACLAGAALAVGVSASAHPAAAGAAPPPGQPSANSCKGRSVCLWANKKWTGKKVTYTCAGRSGNETRNLGRDFPARVPVGVSSFWNRKDTAALIDKSGQVHRLSHGKGQILTFNDKATSLVMVCGPANTIRCGSPGGVGFSCDKRVSGNRRHFAVYWNGSRRGTIDVTRRPNGVKMVSVCDSDPNPRNAGIFLTVDPGPHNGGIRRFHSPRGTKNACWSHSLAFTSRKMRAVWAANSTEWVRGVF